MNTSRPLGPYAIWKVESDDPEEANLGEFCLRHMLATLSNQTLYLGRCTCPTARVLNTPIVSFSPTVDCFFCEQPVNLSPVPHVHEGKWGFGNQAESDWSEVEDEDEIWF